MRSILDRLRAYREDKDLSYEELALDVARLTGRRFSASTLFHLCTDPDPRPQDRTVRKLETYLTIKEAHAKRRPSRRGR